MKIVSTRIIDLCDEQDGYLLEVELDVPEDLKEYRFIWINSEYLIPIADWLEHM
jgi:hypothetical protein